MKFYIFRNSTLESFFSNLDASFSGYDDISILPDDANCYIWFYLLPIESKLHILTKEINSFYNSFELITKQIPSTKTLYVFTLTPLYSNIIETGDFSLQIAINNFNNRVILLSESNRNVKIVDFQSFLSNYSSMQLINWKYYYLSRMLLNPKLAGEFKIWFGNQLEVIQMNRKKCLVLDLDNTLWGGILGEDGINGIKIGGDYPGNAFLDFQKSILELHKAGIILAVCSKNNERDVIEAWNKNPNILIKKEHLAAYKINWDNKAQNIAAIVKQLNIGADSVVFIDDNPAERELVKRFLPMVETPDFPAHPYMLQSFIKEVTEKYFRIYQLTYEDRTKTQQYKDNALRDENQKGFSDFSEYLASLEIVIDLQEANEFTIPRLAQMTQKTNQFNLTTKRYSESDIYSLIEQGHWVYSIAVSDCFGDNGITGLIVITLNHKQQLADIDSLLLSCRILGKGIEEVFVYSMMNKLKIADFKSVSSTYLQTTKNEQVRNFYEELGFSLISESFEDEETKLYKLWLLQDKFEIKPFYKVNIE